MARNHKYVRLMLSEQEERELGRRWREEKDTRAMGRLVEHHMALVMRVCDKVVVLDFGRLLAVGAPAAIRNDPEVRKAYFGSMQLDAEARHG